MSTRPVSLPIAFVFTLFLLNVVAAENWPGWRGPRGDGTSLEKKVPVRWSGKTGENIAWKVEVPGGGHASPIVWRDRVFLVACIEETTERVLVCLNRRDGSTLWQKTVFKGPLETKHKLNSFASSTPATDGELVYVAFLKVDGRTVPAPNVGAPRPITPGEMLVAAYDFDGQQQWISEPGEFVSAHGFCSCPVIFKDLLIINGDHDGESYIVALNKSTGKTVWKVARENKIRSYVTPLIREIDGRTQMVLSGSKAITSYDPNDGSQHWTIDGPTEQFVASMVYDGQSLFMAAGFPTYHVMSVDPRGKGNVTETHVSWHETNARCYVPSPVTVNGLLVVADDRGTANCFDNASGHRLWQERLGNHFSASLVTARGLVYLISDEGMTKVVEPGKELNVVAENELGDYCYSSPAISDGQIFIRGERFLYCIGQPAKD